MADGLRITFVALAYAPSVGGSQVHVQRLAEGLATLGHDVEVLTTDALGSVGSRDPGRVAVRSEVIGGVRVRRHSVPASVHAVHRRLRGAWYRRPWVRGEPVVGPWLAGPWSPSLLAAVRGARRERDVVVACSAPFLTFVAPPRLRGSAVVVGMPLLHLGRGVVAPGVRRALRRCDALVASTEPERDVQRGVAGADVAIDVVPPGVDPATFTDRSPSEARSMLGLPERPTVGYVGRLAAYKGIDTLLAASPAIWDEHPEAGVLVAGMPSGFDGAQAAVRSGLGAGRLVVREAFPDDERALVLAACDVVALPSSDESFGLVIAEGWAACRAVVVADVPAVRWVVRDGEDADVVPPGDVQALAGAINRLLGDSERRARLASAGRRRADDELRWSRSIQRWDEVVRAAAAGDRARAVA